MILLLKKIRNLYNEYFRISDDANIGEKIFYTRLTLYVSAIFLCLFCIGFSSFYLFSFSNSQQTFIFPETDVSIFDERGQAVVESPIGGFSLKANKTYTITLSQPNDCKTDTYYCRFSLISNSGNSVYTTSQISKNKQLTFILQTSSDITVDFLSRPGTYIYFDSEYVVKENETIYF